MLRRAIFPLILLDLFFVGLPGIASAYEVSVLFCSESIGYGSCAGQESFSSKIADSQRIAEDSGVHGVSYVVRFTRDSSNFDRAAAINFVGATATDSIPQLDIVVVSFASDDHALRAQALEENAVVLTIDLDLTRSIAANSNDPDYVEQWALPQIGWDLAYGTIAPSGFAKVAIIDTGIDGSHPDLASNVIPGTSILDGSNGLTDPHGHGTALAGIVAASTNNSVGIAGVAYAGVTLLPVTAFGANGTGTDSDIIAAMVFAADVGADVILLGFTNPGNSSNLQSAVDYAWAKGAVLVAAAGNDGASTVYYPAGHRGVIGVSATDQFDALYSGSSFGDAVFLGAPGASIRTTRSGGGYSAIGGTSAAAAHVAGAAALIKANDPGATNGIIVNRLAANADPAGSVAQTGNGRLNLHRSASATSTESTIPLAVGGGGGLFVGPYALAAVSVDLEHCANGSSGQFPDCNGPNPAGWINSTLSLADPTLGTSHVLATPDSTIPIHSDPALTGTMDGLYTFSGTQQSGDLTMWGGSFVGGSLVYSNDGLSDLDTTPENSLEYCFVATDSNVVIAWSTHLAVRADWDAPGFPSGSPFHVSNGTRLGQFSSPRSGETDLVCVASDDTITHNNVGRTEIQVSLAAVNPLPGPSLSIVKTATPSTYSAVGDVISYSYLVTNNGTVAISGLITVSDDVATDESCPAGNLNPGANLTCTASHTITQADLDAGSVTNVATATGTDPGGNPVTSPPDTETVTAVQGPSLSIVKTATPSTYSAVGDVISYSYLVTNDGNLTIFGLITVSDDVATDESCPAGILNPGANLTCTASHTITQADLDAGSVTNVATATGTDPGGNPVTSPPDTETVVAVQAEGPVSVGGFTEFLIGESEPTDGNSVSIGVLTLLVMLTVGCWFVKRRLKKQG